MDRKSKFEDEDRQKRETERRKREQEENAKAEDAARFQPFASRLGPLLEKEVANVATRLGIQLRLSVSEREIIVSAPGRSRILQSAYPYSFRLYESDGSSVRVRGVDDQRINRNPDMMPDDMSYADYFGTEVTVVNARTTLDDLESGDLAHLMEWLVGMYRGTAPAPQLRAVERAEAEKKSRSSSAGWCLGLALLGIGLPFAGPCALVWAIMTMISRMKTGQCEGRTALGWAIGIGSFATIRDLARVLKGF